MRLVRLVAILVVTITIWALILRTRGFDIEVVSVHVAQQTTGVVFELRNVFGDHVQGAEITIGGKHKKVTDEFGVASVSGLSVGDTVVTISAPGYRMIKRAIHLSPGANQVIFRNEMGLVPDGFAVDFHVYWNTTSGGQARGIAEIALFNGSASPVYVTECDISCPGQALALRLLGSEEGVSSFGRTHSIVGIVSEPEMAVRIESEQIVFVDPVVLPGTPQDGDVYTLRVVSTSNLATAREERDVLIIVDDMDYDGDWDPHVP